MFNAMINSTLWWLAGLSANYVTQDASNDTVSSDSESEMPRGQIIGITLGSFCAVIIALAVTAGCLSCCSTRKTKTTRTNPDGSNETTETEERGSQEVASRIVGVASSVAGEMGEVLAVVTHTVTTADVRPVPESLLNSTHANNVSTTTTTTVDSKAVLLAIKADIADGSSDGNKVAIEGLRLLETQDALAQAAFLITESAKPQQAAASRASIDIHPVDIEVIGASSHLPADH